MYFECLTLPSMAGQSAFLANPVWWRQFALPATVPHMTFTETQLDAAFDWLCHRRCRTPGPR